MNESREMAVSADILGLSGKNRKAAREEHRKSYP